nr:methionyl-tRNA formyltransferase [Fundidesulfovibrio agrisoli]
MRIVFMGTPDFAATVLRRVIASCRHEVVAVYCQPDRPCGRGHKCVPGPVKVLALENGIEVLQPLNFKCHEHVAELASYNPDVLLVAAYGLILPKSVLDIPALGPWNVHGSILPRYRGAAPIQRCIMDGCTETGITIMRMETGLDTGPMLTRRVIPVGPDETAGGLHDRLADLGGEMALEALDLLAGGQVEPEPQDGALATYAAKITREDALIRWDETVEQVHNRIRAMSPRPGAAFMLPVQGENRQIRLLAAPGSYSHDLPPGTPPGCVLGLVSGRLAIACANGTYYIPSVQPAGKKFMDATAFACGYLSKMDPSLPPVCPPPADFLS